MNIHITKLRDNATLPEYQTEHAAAMDLVAAIDQPVLLESLDRAIVPTGLALAVPEGYEAQVRARSGLSAKHGIALANGVGTIDADYRGELGVILVNLSKEPFTIEPGMRIAQLLVAKVERIEWQLVDGLEETSRGKGGYGSTGHN
jgi:dUTP pyrophosphatase